MQAQLNGVRIEYREDGPPDGEPLLLIMGLGMQLIAWPEPFVQALVDRGFRVIRLDNRDVGLSETYDHVRPPNPVFTALKARIGLPVSPPYTLGDMARDAVALLDLLKIERAHVCGASMGGMIAQHLAARFPQRVKSLTLIMTTTGARGLPMPSARLRAALASRPPREGGVEASVSHSVRLMRMIGSPRYPADEAALRQRIRAFIERSFRPQGTTRQMAAIIADGDRSSMVMQIAAPTLVIHGSADPLVPVQGGRDLARKIDGATLCEIEGMGHDIPEPLFGRLADEILGVSRRAAA